MIDEDGDEEYDVVVATLQKAIDIRVDMDKGERFNGMMTTIRFEQIDKLQTAIEVWKRHCAQEQQT